MLKYGHQTSKFRLPPCGLPNWNVVINANADSSNQFKNRLDAHWPDMAHMIPHMIPHVVVGITDNAGLSLMTQ